MYLITNLRISWLKLLEVPDWAPYNNKLAFSLTFKFEKLESTFPKFWKSSRICKCRYLSTFRGWHATKMCIMKSACHNTLTHNALTCTQQNCYDQNSYNYKQLQQSLSTSVTSIVHNKHNYCGWVWANAD